MCGIVGYLGTKTAYPVLINGLKKLEYRGYDSAGVALLDENRLKTYKKAGKVSVLETHIEKLNKKGNIGIAHTRWATHGEPSDKNAHPHYNASESIALVHNGIIENHLPLKKELISRGHNFSSDTDSEVLVHLIEEIRIIHECSLEKAVQIALKRVVGAYAILVISKNDPEKLIAARKSSPLVIGLNEKEFFIASDAIPIIEHTQNVIYLNDEEIAVVRANGEVNIRTIEDELITPQIERLELNVERHELGNYPNYMFKEIHEQKQTIADCLRGRVDLKNKEINFQSISDHNDMFKNAGRVIIVSCGTSWHAGLVAEYLMERLAKLPVEVEYASEFRYRDPIIQKGDIVIPISQSGETADTLAAIEIAKEKGAFIFAICNVAGSSIVRASDAVIFTNAGAEIGVASTKAFTNQLVVLTMMAMQIGAIRGTIGKKKYRQLIQELQSLPSHVETVLKTNSKIEIIANYFHEARNFLYMGRGLNFPIALEGALKLKEISYIHAEGYPAAEMKHGPIALVDEDMPVVVLATNELAHEKVISNIQEITARKGEVIAVAFEDDEIVNFVADHIIEIPKVMDEMAPILSAIPLQLLSYHIALKRNCNVDQPRNLAKSVTVE